MTEELIKEAKRQKQEKQLASISEYIRFLLQENRSLEQKLEQTEKDLTDYQFNYPKIKELEEENNKLLDVINNQDVKIADLEKQLEKMRNCKNCKNYMVEGVCGHFTQVGFCKNWEMQE